MKILHILHRSLPGTHGYAIRSKYIVECQKELSLEPVVITSPFQSGIEGKNGNPEYINGIPYYRTNLFGKIGSKEVRSSSIWKSALRFPLIILFALDVFRITKRMKPSAIHAHSPFYCGLIAYIVSRMAGIPYIYEIRGVWEGSSSPINGNSIKARLAQKTIRWLEDFAVKEANAVVVISEHLKSELQSRNLNNKVYIVPNGVDITKFKPKEKNEKLIEKYSLKGKTVLGYIGTLSAEYEGLEYLIEAMPSIIENSPQAVLLVVGDGRLRALLEGLAERMGIKEEVIFVGRIPHDMITDYYSVMDICVYPRKKTIETDLVTPLKPFEAMACGKAVIGSNVGGIQELVSDGNTGKLFEAENADNLALSCINLIQDKEKRETLSKQAREWVIKNRDWSKIVSYYGKIYNDLLMIKKIKDKSIKHRIEGERLNRT